MATRMEIGIGLPADAATADAQTVFRWARRAEELGFSSLGFSDRPVDQNYEPLLLMTAAAAVTQRIRLTIGVLLPPVHTSTAVLAKQVATLDRLSEGRLVLGVGIGGRDDDYTGNGQVTRGRGKKLDEQIEEMRRIWAGEPRGTAGAIGPAPVRAEGPLLLIGGRSEAAVKRTIRYADGWIAGGGGAAFFKKTADEVVQAWSTAGKAGRPRLVASDSVALGRVAEQHLRDQIQSIYGTHPELAQHRLANAIIGRDRMLAAIADYAAVGCDELILRLPLPEFDQMEHLAETVLKGADGA